MRAGFDPALFHDPAGARAAIAAFRRAHYGEAEPVAPPAPDPSPRGGGERPAPAATKPAAMIPEPIPAPAGEEIRDRAIEAGRRRAAFERAVASAPAGPSDEELIAQAVAAGKVRKVPPGSGLVPGWISGDAECVRPRGRGRGA